MKLSRRHASAALLSMIAAPTVVRAQAYPSRPIRIVAAKWTEVIRSAGIRPE